MRQTTSTTWPELLTDEQVSDFLNVPFDRDHIRRLRAREKLPHICFVVQGTKYFRYPLETLRAWVEGRLRIGNRRVRSSGKSETAAGREATDHQ